MTAKLLDAPYPHCRWPHVDARLEGVVIGQLHQPLSERDRSGTIGAFEQELAAYYGAKYALTFSSGTGALHAACVACGLGPGDEVLTPAYTFFATNSAFAFEGVSVRLCDSDACGNVSVAELADRITPSTKAVVVTHMWGVPCDMRALVELCTRHKLWLIEDCSHAHLATFEGQRVGTFGDVGIFSTNQQALTTGEGGFALTNNLDLYEELLLVGHYNHRCREELRPGTDRTRYALTGYGLKYRMLPLSAAIGRDQLRRMPEIEARRRRNYAVLEAAVGSSGRFELVSPDYRYEHGLYVFSFVVKDDAAGDRDQLVRAMRALGGLEFDAPGSTKPLHDEPLFGEGRPGRPQRVGAQAGRTFPNCTRFYQRLIKCPLWGYAGDEGFVEAYASILAAV